MTSKLKVVQKMTVNMSTNQLSKVSLILGFMKWFNIVQTCSEEYSGNIALISVKCSIYGNNLTLLYGIQF